MKAILLTGIFGLLFFLNLSQPGLIDYDESSYAEVSREMYVRGDLVVHHLNGEAYFE